MRHSCLVGGGSERAAAGGGSLTPRLPAPPAVVRGIGPPPLCPAIRSISCSQLLFPPTPAPLVRAGGQLSAGGGGVASLAICSELYIPEDLEGEETVDPIHPSTCGQYCCKTTSRLLSSSGPEHAVHPASLLHDLGAKFGLQVAWPSCLPRASDVSQGSFFPPTSAIPTIALRTYHACAPASVTFRASQHHLCISRSDSPNH